MKETKYLFDVPVKKDWLFYVFLVVLVSNIIGGLTNVVASGGLSLSSGRFLLGPCLPLGVAHVALGGQCHGGATPRGDLAVYFFAHG